MEGAATASGEAKGEDQKAPGDYKSYVQQGIDEQRYMVPTKGGLIDEIIVAKYKDAHLEAVKEQNTEGGAGKTPEDGDKQPTVNGISSN